MDNIPYNDRIELAIAELESQERLNYAATAKKYQIDRTTLARRHKGETGTRTEAISNSSKALTDLQEKVLVDRINILTDRGMPPTPQFVKNLAEELANIKLGPNRVTRFTKRYKTQLKSIYLHTIDYKRKIADNSHHFKHFFENLQERVERFNILLFNIYNFDEKGFLIGISRTKKRIVGYMQLITRQLLGASQDGNREFITLIAAICGDGLRIYWKMVLNVEDGLLFLWLLVTNNYLPSARAMLATP